MPEYLANKGSNDQQLINRTGFVKLNVAIYQNHESDLMCSEGEKLTNAGYDVQMMINPSPQNVNTCTKIGFHFSPIWITWHQPVVSFENLVEKRILSNGLLRSCKSRFYDYKRKVRKSLTTKECDIQVTSNTLNRETWKTFYNDVYSPWVVSKSSGFDYAGLDFPQSVLKEGGDLKLYSLLEFRDFSNQEKLIAGILLERFFEESILKIKFAAFSRADKYKNLYLSHRAHHEVVNIAENEGFSVISYGSEPNFYAPEGKADMITTGLHNFKASLCFEPIVLDRVGYREKRLLRLLSKKIRQESECFFYQYRNHQGGLEVCSYGSKNIRCPVGVRVVSTKNLASS